jgi:hypothetical protein
MAISSVYNLFFNGLMESPIIHFRLVLRFYHGDFISKEFVNQIYT